MDTTVSTGGTFIGGSTVHNIGLQDERRAHLLIGGLLVLIGTILIAADIIRGQLLPGLARIAKGQAGECGLKVDIARRDGLRPDHIYQP